MSLQDHSALQEKSVEPTPPRHPWASWLGDAVGSRDGTGSRNNSASNGDEASPPASRLQVRGEYTAFGSRERGGALPENGHSWSKKRNGQTGDGHIGTTPNVPPRGAGSDAAFDEAEPRLVGWPGRDFSF